MTKWDVIRLLLVAAVAFVAAPTSSAADGDLTKDPVLKSCRQDDVEVYEIEYESDGLNISGYLLAPKAPTADGYPCIIYNRGGNNRGEDPGKLELNRVVCNRLAPLAAQGYVVVASQYRGLGDDAPWGSNGDEFGGNDVNDVLNLIPLLKRISADEQPTGITLPLNLATKVNANRMGMYGWSRGGMMTYLALRRLREQSEDFPVETAVVGAGVTDLFDSELRRPGMRHNVHGPLIPDYDSNRTNALQERSAVRWVEKLPKSVDILLLHGTWDENVHISQARRMQEMMVRYGIPHQSYFVERAGHDFITRPFVPTAINDSVMHDTKLRDLIVHDWFKHHLH